MKEEHRDWVMSNGPWHFDGTRPITLQAWNPDLLISWEDFDRIPLWVCLPYLPPTFYNNHMLSRIGSDIGNPIYMDQCTIQGEKLSYARLLISVSPQEALIREIEEEKLDGSEKMKRLNF